MHGQTILRICYVSQAREQQTDLGWIAAGVLARPRAATAEIISLLAAAPKTENHSLGCALMTWSRFAHPPCALGLPRPRLDRHRRGSRTSACTQCSIFPYYRPRLIAA
jgi:hypothetical protein